MGKAVTSLNAANETKYFYPADDQWIMKLLPMTASVAMAAWVLIQHETNWAAVTGNYRTLVSVENLNGDDIYGILAEPIEATDADYATAGKLKAVWIPKWTRSEAYFAVWAGTFTAADVGKTVEVHSDFKSLAVDTLGKWATITWYISSTRGKCIFNMPNTEVA